MTATATDVRGNEITIQMLAELKIKSDAFHASKTMSTKRGGNPFFGRFYRNLRLLANATDKTESELQVEIHIFIAKNPMRYAVTSDRLTYLAK